MIEIGLKYTSELTVTDAVTAIKVCSGDLPVLATPMMMALMENAAMLAVKTIGIWHTQDVSDSQTISAERS